MRKKLIAGTIALTMICVAAGAGTMAYFTSQTSTENNTFVTGTLKLGGIIDGEDMVEEFARMSIQNIKPGLPVHIGTTQLKNVGSLPFKLYRITASDFKGSGWDMLDDQLALTVKIGGEQVYNGTISDLRAANGGYFDPIYNVLPDEVRDMELTVLMNAAAGNDYQGKNITCDFTVYATQNEAPNNGEPNNERFRFGPAQDSNGSTAQPTFVVDGYNTSSQVCFDWDWRPDDNIVFEKYVLDIKHETGYPTTNIQEVRIFIFPDEQVVSVDGIDEADVSVDWSNDVVKINKSAFPVDWEGFEVKLSGLQNNPFGTEKAISYTYWSLNR